MEFMTGVNKKDTVEISEILAGDFEGKTVKVNGAVHTIRDMGEVAFVVLRKREGLLQCVFEEGKTKFDLKDLKEAATVEVEGAVKSEDRAPNGFEIRLDSIRVLSEPAAPMPLAISKWKLNTSLEANLNNRSIALRNIRERAKFKIQKVSSEDSVIFFMSRDLPRSTRRRSVQKALRVVQICSVWTISTDRLF